MQHKLLFFFFKYIYPYNITHNIYIYIYTQVIKVYLFKQLISRCPRSYGNVGKKPWSDWSKSIVETLGRKRSPWFWDVFRWILHVFYTWYVYIYIYIHMYSTIMGFYEDYMKITILFFLCLYDILQLYKIIYIYDSIFDSIVFFFFIMLLIMMCCIVPFNTSSVASVSQASRAEGKRRYTRCWAADVADHRDLTTIWLWLT